MTQLIAPLAPPTLLSSPDEGAAASISSTPRSVCLRAGPVLTALVMAAAVLVVLHGLVVLAYVADWRLPGIERFYLDHEGNVPTWFSSVILLTAALLLAVIGTLERGTRDPFWRQWLLLGALFLGLSLDEAASFHEVLIKPMASLFNASGFFRFGWVIAGIVFSAAVFGYYLPFLAALPQRTRALFLLSGGVYVAGAIGLEMVGGYYFPQPGTTGAALVPYMLAMTVEETLEMAGILVFIHTLLDYLRSHAPAIELRVR